MRESAFPDGIPACTSQRDAWKLALTAQKNGAYAAAFEPLTRSAARADILNEYVIKDILLEHSTPADKIL